MAIRKTGAKVMKGIKIAKGKNTMKGSYFSSPKQPGKTSGKRA